MANQSVGTPVFYIDYTQIAKYRGFFIDGNDLDVEQPQSVVGQNVFNVWNFDYINPFPYDISQDNSCFNMHFFDHNNEETYSLNFARFLSTMNWVGIINHNIKSSLTEPKVSFKLWDGVNNYITALETQQVLNDGYNIFDSQIESNDFTALKNYSAAKFEIESDEPGTSEIGSIAFGRKIEMPQSPELKVVKTVDYDGITSKRSLGGSDYVQINNSGCPDWVNGQSWNVDDANDNIRIGKNGRRKWSLQFAHVAGNSVFYDATKSNSFGDVDNIDEPLDFFAGDEIQQVFDLLLGNAFKFIFQPNKNVEEYAICRLDQKSFSATQVAPSVYSFNMNIVESW